MRKMNLLKLSIFVLLAAALSFGQATRTWVSGVGDDANPCSRTAPCKTFAGAISKTAPGGEIDALDPGGFGALTITKSITLDGGGGQVASVLVAGTNGIVVAAGAGDIVIIRNLRFDGLRGGGNANAGLSGIKWISGKALHIENCTIFGFNNNAIDINKSDGGKAFVIDTVAANNGNAGLQNANTNNYVAVLVDNSHFDDNVSGVVSASFSNIAVRNSEASGNSGTGFLVSASLGTGELQLVNSTAWNNGTGISAGGGAVPSLVRMTGSSLFGNGVGIQINSNGTVSSAGNNTNANSGAPNGTAVPVM
jgi:hypothetical protein